MKTVLIAAVAVFGFAASAGADPIEGVWKTQPDDGVYYHVKMKPCGAGFCGEFIQKFADGQKVQTDVIGKNAVYDLVAQGGGKYEGKAWKPSNNKTYKGSGTLNGDTLKVGGCVLGGLICLKQTWNRVN